MPVFSLTDDSGVIKNVFNIYEPPSNVSPGESCSYNSND